MAKDHGFLYIHPEAEGYRDSWLEALASLKQAEAEKDLLREALDIALTWVPPRNAADIRARLVAVARADKETDCDER